MVRKVLHRGAAWRRSHAVLTPLLWRGLLGLTLLGSLTGPALAQLSATPGPLTFGSQAVNVASGVQTITLTNTGATPQTITGINFTGAGAGSFAFEPITFPVTLEAGQSLPVNVTFTPTLAGDVTADLAVSVEGGTPQTVSVTGAGALPTGVTVFPTTLTFTDQGVNTTSGAQTITICGTEATPLVISSVNVTGDFVVVDTGTPNLGKGSCIFVSVLFRPTATGTRTGTLTINTTAGPVVIGLTGAGAGAPAAGPQPRIIAPERAVLFPALDLCATYGKPRGLDIVSSGTAPLTINNVTVTGPAAGDFRVVQSCVGSPLDARRMCRIFILFTPTFAGPRNAFLTINSNAPGGPMNIALVGVGRGAGLGVSASNVIFTQLTGTVGTQTITLTNPGTTPVTVGSLDVTGAGAGSFTLDPVTLPVTIAPGASQTVTIHFTPTAAGLATANLAVGTGAACPSLVLLSGTGLAVPVPGQPPTGTLALTPGTLAFGDQTVNVASGPQNVNVTNVGSAPLTVTGVSFVGEGGGFAFTQLAFPLTLQPGESMPVGVTFTPTAAGAATATLEVATSAGPQTITLTGTGA